MPGSSLRNSIFKVSIYSIASVCLFFAGRVVYRYAFSRQRSWKKNDAQLLLEEGLRLLEEQSLEGAIRHLSKAVGTYPEEHPNFLKSLINRATAYLLIGDVDAALKDCEYGLRIDRLNREIMLCRSCVYETIGDLERAVEDMVALIALDTSDSMRHKKRLEQLLCKYAERFSKQERSFKLNSFESKWILGKFLRCFRKHWPEAAKTTVGSLPDHVSLQLQACDYESALNSLQQAAVSNPSALAYDLIGTLHLIAGNSWDAQEALLNSLGLYQANVPVLVKCALLAMEMGKYPEMAEHIEAALAIDDQDPTIYYFRGEILAACDNFEAAIDDFKRAVQLDETFACAYVSQARAYLALERVQAAHELLKKPMDMFPGDPELLHVFGEILLLQGDREEGLSTWLQVLDLAPNFPDINLNLAVLDYALNGCEKAYEAALLSIVGKFPHFGAGHIQLAQLYLARETFEKAAHHFDKAISEARSLQESIAASTLKVISIAKARVAKRFPEHHSALSVLHSHEVFDILPASIRPQSFIHSSK